MTLLPHSLFQKEHLRQATGSINQVLLECKDFAIILIDIAGHVADWNIGAQHIFGYTSAEALGKHIGEFYPDEKTPGDTICGMLKAACEKGRNEYEGWNVKKDRSRFFANSVITVLRDDTKAITGYAKITRDITVQKELELEIRHLNDQLEEKISLRTKELATANKELEAFSYSVSHDLRAPLRAISGYTNMLKEDYEAVLDTEGKRILRVITDNSRMMSQLIDDLLSFSKMSRLEVMTNEVDMKALAEQCIAEHFAAKPYTANATVGCTFNIHDLPKCKADKSMLKQVWHNLIGNAIKYSSARSNPMIEIGATSDGRSNTYFVKDNGAGFNMKYYEKLFGVFQRLHRHDEYEGTGLGLALAKRIVNKHGGEIWAKSSLNEGATFYFSMPHK